MTDQQRLVDELLNAGWTRVSEPTGDHVRLIWPGMTDRTALYIPLDPAAAHFTDLWQAALAELEDTIAAGVLAADVLARFYTTPGRVEGRIRRLEERQP